MNLSYKNIRFLYYYNVKMHFFPANFRNKIKKMQTEVPPCSEGKILNWM